MYDKGVCLRECSANSAEECVPCAQSQAPRQFSAFALLDLVLVPLSHLQKELIPHPPDLTSIKEQ